MAESFDEFSFLPQDAAAVGRDEPLPPVCRHTLGPVSALAWGSAPAEVVLLHGAALNAHTWDATLLAWDVPALAVDLPGHGDSEWRDDGNYSPRVIAPSLTSFLRQAGDAGLLAPRVALVGQSLGGLTGVEVARHLPGEVGHVVLVDILPLPHGAASQVAAFLDGPSSFPSREAVVERAAAAGLGGQRDALERAVILNTRVRGDGTVVWKHHLGVIGAKGLPTGELMGGWDAIEALAVPVDLVRGERGLIDETAAREFAARIPGSRTSAIAAGHNIQEDAPAELARVLAELLPEAKR